MCFLLMACFGLGSPEGCLLDLIWGGACSVSSIRLGSERTEAPLAAADFESHAFAPRELRWGRAI